MSWLCRLFGHKTVFIQKWYPGISAEIVEEFLHITWCSRCKKEVDRVHWRWDGRDLVDVQPGDAVKLK
jgi:hypothetical protein